MTLNLFLSVLIQSCTFIIYFYRPYFVHATMNSVLFHMQQKMCSVSCCLLLFSMISILVSITIIFNPQLASVSTFDTGAWFFHNLTITSKFFKVPRSRSNTIVSIKKLKFFNIQFEKVQMWSLQAPPAQNFILSFTCWV